MDNAATDDIREDIEVTRANLDEKMQQLTVRAHEAVDVRHHVANHPWIALGLATATGFLFAGRRRGTHPPTYPVAPQPILHSRHDLGLLGEAALLLVTSVARSALREKLQAFGTAGDPGKTPRQRAARRARTVREHPASTRNGDQRG